MARAMKWLLGGTILVVALVVALFVLGRRTAWQLKQREAEERRARQRPTRFTLVP